MTLRDLKGLLLFFMLIGAAAYFGGGTTLASFSAETTNPGSAVSSGTLTMSDQVNTGTACLSAGGTPQNNVNPACAAVLALTNVAPGVYGGVAQVTVQNTGSIDASKLYFWAPPVNATLNGALTSGNAVTTLTVTPLEGTVTSGDAIVYVPACTAVCESPPKPKPRLARVSPLVRPTAVAVNPGKAAP